MRGGEGVRDHCSDLKYLQRCYQIASALPSLLNLGTWHLVTYLEA